MLHSKELTFNHFVVSTTDGTIFASARDKNNKVHNFLISRCGDVKEQARSSFEPVDIEYARRIREKVQSSIVPVYKVNAINVS
jgi:hypothetical protein